LFIFAQAFCGAENVAGGEVAGAEAFTEHFGLGALADTGWAEHDDAPGLSQGDARGHFANGGTAFEPSGAIRLRHQANRIILRKKSV
jgi:hypothetical protein